MTASINHHGRVLVRAAGVQAARAQLIAEYGRRSEPHDIMPVTVDLPYTGMLMPSAVLDVDGVQWGLHADRPLLTPAAEFLVAAGMPWQDAQLRDNGL